MNIDQKKEKISETIIRLAKTKYSTSSSFHDQLVKTMEEFETMPIEENTVNGLVGFIHFAEKHNISMDEFFEPLMEDIAKRMNQQINDSPIDFYTNQFIQFADGIPG